MKIHLIVPDDDYQLKQREDCFKKLDTVQPLELVVPT